MELPMDVEDILSDDYEEGEILDGDNLYDEVSSLEEFSSCDEVVENSPVSDNQNASSEKCRRRRKDHKCKEESVCRKERKGKHCYARIRKSKSIPKTKSEHEVVYQPNVSKMVPQRKLDVNPITRFLKCSPTRIRHDPPPKIPHRNDHKDYHEKENRYVNRRYWTTAPRNKLKPCEKYVNYCRNRPNKDNYYSKSRHQMSSSPLRAHCVETSSKNLPETENSLAKTSLLKRLVGSGTSGLKPMKDDEPVSVNQNNDPVDIPAAATEETKTATLQDKQDTIEEVTKPENTASTDEAKCDECLKTEAVPEQPKKFEVRWIRSIKDDKDELHLRVEALRSAWVKKFHDRKKKGLVHQKKTDGDEDFLEHFAFGSDSENDEKITTIKGESIPESESLPHFKATDISGDILKPEDMVIANDKLSEESSIISETTVASTEGITPVFADPLFLSAVHLPPETASLLENSSKRPTERNSVASEQVLPNKKKSNQNHSQCSNRSRSSKSKSQNRRKSRSSNVKTSKHASNTSADLDEDSLRELALQSLKTKNRKGTVDNESKPSNQSPVLHSITGGCEVSTESESIGTAHNDNWEDDLDEDILRAKLLSSLTKQISEESDKIDLAASTPVEPIQTNIIINPKILKPTINIIKPPISKKQPVKKVDGRKVRNTKKKIWKQDNPFIERPKTKPVLNTINRFTAPTVLKKKDNIVHPQENNQFNARPIPQVPKMIITLDDSDSSSDTEPTLPDPLDNIGLVNIVANIDNFLREAELNTLLEKGVLGVSSSASKEETTKMPEKENCNLIDNLSFPSESMHSGSQETQRAIVQTPSSTSSSSSCGSLPTPQAVKHLPPWQQEEYKRLKKKLAEKEEVLRVTRSKIIETAKDINVNNQPPSDPAKTETKIVVDPVSIILGNAEPSPNSSSSGTVGSVDNAATVKPTEMPQALHCSKDEVSKSPTIAKKPTAEESSAAKKNYNNLVSCSIMEEINLMNDVLNDFDKNTTAYLDLKQKLERLKRIVKSTETKLAAKKKRMLTMRDKINEKERQISSKITTFCMNSSPNEKNKLPTREMELVKLKHKEVSLRAQFLFHDFLNEKVQGKEIKSKMSGQIADSSTNSDDTATCGIKRLPNPNQPMAPFKKKLKASESVNSVLHSEKVKENLEVPLKRNFSGKERERDEWDPNTPVCHYDLNGICRDDQCQYQHFKTV